MNSGSTATPDLRRVDFGFFKVCLARSHIKLPWKLEGPRKLNNQGQTKEQSKAQEAEQLWRRPAWLYKKFPVKELDLNTLCSEQRRRPVTFRGPFKPKKFYDSILCRLLNIKIMCLLSLL